ncbi:MAG: DMT family transporter [Xanthobacteraceae bacterium]
MAAQHGLDEITKAKFLLVLLAFVWGLSWPIMTIALAEISVWTLRVSGFSISALSLFALIRLQGRSAAIPRGVTWLHIVAASLFNVVGFGLFSSFALLAATTSRVVIVNYSMPIWASLMAWLILGERLSTRAAIGLVLCVSGLSVLVYPVATEQSAAGLLLALCCALSWAAGTVYMKWARMSGDLLAITAWQIALGAVVFGVGLLLFQGVPGPAAVSLKAVLAVVYNGLIGTGFAYILWFAIIERLPTATASLGSLATPVVGVSGSMLMLGERPTTADMIGFALIFAAAVCVLMQPGRRAAAQTPRGAGHRVAQGQSNKSAHLTQAAD